MSNLPSNAEAASPNNHNDIFFIMMRKMLFGQLDEGETELLFMLMEQSEENVEMADALWAEHLANIDEVPELDSEKARRITSMIEKRIHRADFSSELFRIGIQGIPTVWLALLKPLLTNPPEWGETQNRSGDEYNGQ